MRFTRAKGAAPARSSGGGMARAACRRSKSCWCAATTIAGGRSSAELRYPVRQRAVVEAAVCAAAPSAEVGMRAMRWPVIPIRPSSCAATAMQRATLPCFWFTPRCRHAARFRIVLRQGADLPEAGRPRLLPSPERKLSRFPVIVGVPLSSPRVAVLGGGLAGLAAAPRWAVPASKSICTNPAPSWEAAPRPGRSAREEAEMVDNCQHVLLRCCVNLLDLYRRLGVGREDPLLPRVLLHRTGRTPLLAEARHAARARPLRRLVPGAEVPGAGRQDRHRARHERHPRRGATRNDLDRITMLDWLREKRQTERAIERYWRQVLVSAINEELRPMAAVARLPGVLAGHDGARRFL